MTRIGVISDTHGLLRPEAQFLLAGVDHIIHAGDIGGPDIIPSLEKIAPVTAIKGNIDRASWAGAFADEETLAIAGHKIFVLHNRNDWNGDPKASGFDIFISGHSHKPTIETIDASAVKTPANTSPRRFTLPIALATLELTDGSVLPRIHEILA